MSTFDTDLGERSSHIHFETLPIRYSDQDAMGHVNNVSYAAYFEAGRFGLFQRMLGDVREDLDGFVLASVKIDYLREMHFPGDIEVGGCMLRLGKRSLTTGYGVFKGDVCYATCVSVNVFFDAVARVSKDPSPEIRARIEAFQAAG